MGGSSYLIRVDVTVIDKYPPKNSAEVDIRGPIKSRVEGLKVDVTFAFSVVRARGPKNI